MALTEHYIVVNVPKAEDTAFVAMPFSEVFKELYTSIAEAATNVNLMPRRVDKNPQDTNFIRDIINQIQSARIVVAVCSPEPDTDRPNPNVMYELGLAHSIGKCTIILSSNIDLLPTDLKGEQILSYTSGEEKSNSFIDKLTNRFNLAKDMVIEDDYTSKHYKNIFAAKPSHWIHLSPTLWDHCLTILSFAKDVLDQFQSLDSAYIEPFRMTAEKVAAIQTSSDSESQLTIKIDCQKAWNNYSVQYANTCNLFIKRLPERQQKIEYSFRSLLGEANRDAKKLLNKSNDFYGEIESQLKFYHEIHSEILAKADLGILAEQFSDTTQLWFKTTKLSQTAITLISLSNRLVRNIIQIFLE